MNLHNSLLFILGFIYTQVIKRILFLIDPWKVHNTITDTGELMGGYGVVKVGVSSLLRVKDSSLVQKIAGITFTNPIGLAAGFDYEGKLTQILPFVGFGFQSIGTITNNPYGGNPSPLLGRLPKSRSLMVNKGFKNLGAEKTANKLSKLDFQIPVGISIGKTNTLSLKTQKESISDIIQAFTTFENSKSGHSYYELNISCPNLLGNISFYPPQNLQELLNEIDGLRLNRPVFIKMPIEKSNGDVIQMLEVIAKSSAKGVIFGNLQKDRRHPSFDKQEVARFRVGNFSGKPTFERSNELIQLTSTHFKDRLKIIGCGGVFSSHDAYTKIKLGASLVQLITGMIFQGPQLIAQINLDLVKFLKRDGFRNISEAIGTNKAN